jgi:hypothetical protein
VIAAVMCRYSTSEADHPLTTRHGALRGGDSVENHASPLKRNHSNALFVGLDPHTATSPSGERPLSAAVSHKPLSLVGYTHTLLATS